MHPAVIMIMQNSKMLFFLEGIMWGVFAIAAILLAPYILKSLMFLGRKVKALYTWIRSRKSA